MIYKSFKFFVIFYEYRNNLKPLQQNRCLTYLRTDVQYDTTTTTNIFVQNNNNNTVHSYTLMFNIFIRPSQTADHVENK